MTREAWSAGHSVHTECRVQKLPMACAGGGHRGQDWGTREHGKRTRAETVDPRRRGTRAPRRPRGGHLPRLSHLLRELLRAFEARATGAAARPAPLRAGRRVRREGGRGGDSRGPARAAWLLRRLGARRRHRGLGRSGLHPRERRQRPEQGVRRGGRARARDALGLGREAPCDARRRRRPGHPRQPADTRVHQLQHSGRGVLPRGGARVPRARRRTVAGHHHRRDLRRPDSEHHRRTVDHQRRSAQPGGLAPQRHHGVAPGGPRAREGSHRARRQAVRGGAREGPGIGGAGRRTFQRTHDRPRHPRPVAGRGRRAFTLRVRRAHPRGVRGRPSVRRPVDRGRPARADDRRAGRDAALAHRHCGRTMECGRR